MTGFYDSLAADDVATVEGLSRLLQELRDSRDQLLARYALPDATALLEGIKKGELAEHPGYEDYLGVCIIEAQREHIRDDLKAYMLDINTP